MQRPWGGTGKVPKGAFQDGLLVECVTVHRILALLLLLKPAMRRGHGSMTVLRYTRTLRLSYTRNCLSNT